MRLLDLLNEASHQWETPEFRRWFRHSIVRDRRGNPARVYHATHVRDAFGNFDTFDRQGAMKHLNREENADAVGMWFSDRPDRHGAGMYIGDGGTPETAHGAIYPVYLRIENPWRPNSAEEYFSAFHRAAGRDPKSGGRGSVEEFREWLKSRGHDGIMFGPEVGVDRFGDSPGQRVWVVLEPNQIKSATGNRGSFSDSPNITEEWDEDQYEPRTWVLKAGSFVYHGTQSDEFDNDLNFPAWVSNSPKVAHKFIGWHHDGSTPRVMKYRVIRDQRLIQFDSSGDIENWLESRGEDTLWSAEELSEIVCQAGFDGWTIPNNYPEGADIMLCSDCLQHVRTKKISDSPNITEDSSPVLLPAIRWKGKIYIADWGSTSHFDALSKVPEHERQGATLDGDSRIFVTGTGRKLNRWSAHKYAIQNDLLSKNAPSYARTSSALIGEWLKSVEELRESHINEATQDYVKKAVDPALMTSQEYHDFLNPKNKFHPRSAYDVDVEKLSSYVRREDYPRLVNRKIIRGEQFELRERKKRNWDQKYTKTDAEGWVLRGEDGMALYMSPEEVAATGVPEYDYTFAIFDAQGRTVASAENEWGTWLFMVAREKQGLGLGPWLGRVARDRIPDRTSGGFTPQGWKNLAKIHEQLVREYLSSGMYSWLVKSGQITVERVKEILSGINRANITADEIRRSGFDDIGGVYEPSKNPKPVSVFRMGGKQL